MSEPEAPKFRPGDPAVVADRSDTRCGRVVWLAERRLGLIAGRPYWLARETPGGYPNIAVTEDALGPTVREPVIPTLEQRQAALRARPAGLAAGPGPFAGRHRPDPEPPLHDGQAVTSSLRRETLGPSAIREALMRQARSIREATIGPPGALDTVSIVEGVERWRLRDPAHRRAWTQGTGHSIEVHITVLPSLTTHRTKFHTGDSADRVVNWLDGVAGLSAAHPNAAIAATMSKNPPYRFAEDSGEIEP